MQIPLLPNRSCAVAVVVAAAWLALAGAVCADTTAHRAEVPVEQFTLDNGMTFLLVQRPQMTTVAAGWVAKVGSANERPGITGLSHFFEHMMFKGSRVIGTTDITRDLAIQAEQEAVQERMREIYAEQRLRWRRGQIADPYAPENRTEELKELAQRFAKLVEEQRALMVKEEFSKLYTEAGGTGLNAGTDYDMTFYFITVPANKLELWFWLESDRLASPVFRDFYAERDVVHEERRLRTESTPTGKFEELFDSLFWQSHPYGWPVVGWPSDLQVISQADADAYYATYYAPNNLTVALVGNFEPAVVRRLAERYFGRLQRGKVPPPEVVTLEMPQLAEKRMLAECDCQPQVEVRYHTVPFEHADSYALDVLSALLNGRTGRLYKSLVLGEQVAVSAMAYQESRKWAGYFSFQAEAKGEATPARLEEAWYAELAKLQNEPVQALELEKVKNQIAAGAFRRLDSNFFLMLQLLLYEGYGDWTYLNTWAEKTLAVTAEDVQRVAKQYFAPENRSVALYRRKAGAPPAAPMPPGFDELSPNLQQMVRAQLRQLAAVNDPEVLRASATAIGSQVASAPPELRPAMQVILTAIELRLAELLAAAPGGEK
ncbi:MAG: insulinase family protein [Acidobacteria bacterium]|nr:insulinase family protein [Thermoanaerobaculia bacterium]MDI9630371.1 pitrilysin family protein [Acidobacteriota bacterium]MBP7812585.1 insulinase family protein [Thermoanaerobaculia bacterium]MBP8844703.1 insulinase family protein [Thermoanaerobaculia bacterium]NLN12547.1 insulinase family protein [Acidobacteriota bacterium]